MGGDCTNFVSQCLLADGIHFQEEWLIYKLNNSNPSPTSGSQLDASWYTEATGGLFGTEIGASSPWISAKIFGDFWKERVPYFELKGSDIISNPYVVLGRGIGLGDVVQTINSSGEGTHSMFISDYGYYGGNLSFCLTYHSDNTLAKNLLELAEDNPNQTFRFYNFG